MYRIVLFGASGFMGTQIADAFRASGIDPLCPTHKELDVENTTQVEQFLQETEATHVVCCVGRVGTLDTFESKSQLRTNLRDNLYLPVSLAILCDRLGVHFTYIGTGCIFSSKDPVVEIVRETDEPNFFGSVVSTTKGFTDRLLRLFPQALLLRLRLPILADDSAHNLVTKLQRFKTICSVSNSMSVMPTLVGPIVDMVCRKRAGVVNCVNPGVITHNEILELYRDIVDPECKWENVSVEEQNARLGTERSNTQLDTARLLEWYPDVPRIADAVKTCMEQIKARRGKDRDGRDQTEFQ